MNTIAYLKERYGCGVPIFLKDIRIGGKSKTAIKQALYRACKKGEISKDIRGVYYFPRYQELFVQRPFPEDVLQEKYIGGTEASNSQVFGYRSGLTFLNDIHLSEQVPAILEITTNKTSSKKYELICGWQRVWLRKPKTKITSENWRVLQFLDMFHFTDIDEVNERKKLFVKYIEKWIPKGMASRYFNLYPRRTVQIIVDSGLIDYL